MTTDALPDTEAHSPLDGMRNATLTRESAWICEVLVEAVLVKRYSVTPSASCDMR